VEIEYKKKLYTTKVTLPLGRQFSPSEVVVAVGGVSDLPTHT